jgi:glucose dehydrogenase
MGRLARLVVLASSVFAAAVFGQTNGTHGAKPCTTWTGYGGGSHSSQYSALDQINKSNVSRLEVAWTFRVTGTVVFNPLVVDDMMFLQASVNTLAAVDAADGKEIWRRQMQGPIGARGRLLQSIRHAARFTWWPRRCRRSIE